MKRIIPLIFLIVTTVFSCDNHGTTYEKLVKADSLITAEKDSAALNELLAIQTDELTTEKEQAYYNLLLTCARYRLYLPTTSDSAITASIEYYKRTNDKQKLAKALYYKGMTNYELGKTELSIRLLKEAENIAEKTKNTAILNYIYINLAGINSHLDNDNTALKYAKASLKTAEKRKDKDMICISLNKISESLSSKNVHDSALYYAEKAIPYVKYLKKKEKTTVLADIGASYFNEEQFDKAEQYVRQSLAVEPTAYAYFILGSIYLETGRGSEAEALWNNVMRTGGPELRAETMLWMADLKKAEGKYREAAELLAKGEAMEDSIASQKETEKMLSMQGEMEHSDTKREAKRQLTIAGITTICIAILMVMLIVYSKKRMKKANERLAEIEKQTDKYLQKIDELSLSKHENEKEINRLNRKIETLRAKRSAIIGLGQKRYEEIMDGGTVVAWTREDFEATIEYCRTLRPEVVSDIEKGHKRLTPYNTLFLLLPFFGVSDDAIPYAMNMTPGAARTMKYRMKSKEVC